MQFKRLMGLGALATLFACAACQTYRPLELASVRRGTRVRVETNRPVPLRLREVTIEQARLVDAEAIGVENGSLMLSAMWVERDGGIGTPGEGWTVGVPVEAVRTLSERRFSWVRTAIAGGVLVVGSTLGWRVFGSGASGGVSGGTGGEPL